MSYWIPYEVLKITASYLLSPAFICSNAFLATIGYKNDIDTVLSKAAQSNQSRIVRSDLSSNLDVVKSNELDDEQIPNEQLTPSDTNYPHQQSESEVSIISSRQSGYDSSFDTTNSTTSLPDLEATFYDQEVTTSDSISTRPLSFALAIFSYRATRCFSSFELLSEDHFGKSASEERVLEMVQPGEVVSIVQVEMVRKVLASEAKVVKRIIEEAIEKRGIAVEDFKVVKGTTYFDDLKKSFVDVRVDRDGISTLEFLEAVESSLTLFKQFASSAFVLVQSDVFEDIRRIRARYDSFPEQCRTLEMLIINESTQRRKLATTSLFWLVKGFKFVSLALRFNINSEEELYTSFTRSWESEYSLYFSWIVRQFFSPLVRAVPNRDVFYKSLGENIEDVKREIIYWVDALDNFVMRLEIVLPKKL